MPDAPLSETKCECPERKILRRLADNLYGQILPLDDNTRETLQEARAALADPCCCEGLREKAIAEFIDDHGINCDCCQHVMIDVTSAQTEEQQHCVAGDSEGEGVGCAHSWHETVGHVEDERDQLRAELAEARKDSARLDWLENELNENRYRMDIALQSDEEDGVWFVKFYRRETGAVHGIPYDWSDSRTQTVRAAIDEAVRCMKIK